VWYTEVWGFFIHYFYNFSAIWDRDWALEFRTLCQFLEKFRVRRPWRNLPKPHSPFHRAVEISFGNLSLREMSPAFTSPSRTVLLYEYPTLTTSTIPGLLPSPRNQFSWRAKLIFMKFFTKIIDTKKYNSNTEQQQLIVRMHTFLK